MKYIHKFGLCTDLIYSTIVSTALPRIGSEFNNSSIVAWVATSYILTFDAFRKQTLFILQSMY